MLAAQQHPQQQGVPAPGTGAGVAAGGGGGTMRIAAGAKAREGVGAAADPAPNSEESSMRGRWPPVALQVDNDDGSRSNLTNCIQNIPQKLKQTCIVNCTTVAGASDGALSAAHAESYSPEARCAALDPMLSSRRQRELCRRSFRTLVVLAQGAGIAIEGKQSRTFLQFLELIPSLIMYPYYAECQFQFRNSRWNCSILSGPNLFGQLTTLSVPAIESKQIGSFH